MTLKLSTLLNRRGALTRCLLTGACAVFAHTSFALSIPQRMYLPSGGTRSIQRVPKSLPSGYLSTSGPMSLRFAPPPAEASERPAPVVVPPTPEPVLPEPIDEEPTESIPVEPEPVKPEPTPTPAPNKAITILPDDTPRDLRAEDVLPFFQLPADPDNPTGASVVVPFTPATPANPGTQPPSSATYQLK